MRIAFDIRILGAFVVAVLFGLSPLAAAQALDSLAAAAPASGASVNASSQVPTSNPTSLPQPVLAQTSSGSVPLPAALPLPPAKSSAGGLAAAENKIPDSVKDVLARLDKPTDDVTLDDLNSARQAIAKIEILIDIEKHLAELDKVRRERRGGGGDSSFASMIPASALQPPVYTPQTVPQASAQMQNMGGGMPSMSVKEQMEVTQVSGGNGHYVAMIKAGGEEAKSVHVGDHLSDGSSVTSISPMEVVLDRSGTKHTLHLKNIDAVFGNSF